MDFSKASISVDTLASSCLVTALGPWTWLLDAWFVPRGCEDGDDIEVCLFLKRPSCGERGVDRRRRWEFAGRSREACLSMPSFMMKKLYVCRRVVSAMGFAVVFKPNERYRMGYLSLRPWEAYQRCG